MDQILAFQNSLYNLDSTTMSIIYCGFFDINKNVCLNFYLSNELMLAFSDLYKHPIIIWEYKYNYNGVGYVNYVVTNLTHSTKHLINYSIPHQMVEHIPVERNNYHSTNPISIHFNENFRKIYTLNIEKTEKFHQRIRFYHDKSLLNNLIFQTKLNIPKPINQYAFVYQDFKNIHTHPSYFNNTYDVIMKVFKTKR